MANSGIPIVSDFGKAAASIAGPELSGAVASVGSVAIPIASSYFLGPAAASYFGVGATAGGAIAGGLASGLTGGNVVSGALAGGLTGFGASGGFDGLFGGAASGADAMSMASADAAQLAAQGVPQAQIEGMLSSTYGLNPFMAADVSQMASQGLSESAIMQNIGSTGTASGIGLSGAIAKDYAGASSLNEMKGILGYGAQLAGGYMQQQAAKDAAATQAQAQIRAAQIAADAAKFRPVGVTTRFGASQFGTDAQGNLTSAGYVLSPEMKAQQNKLMGISEGALTQYQGAQAATAPMGQAAQSMMTMGQGYLSTSPQEQAAKYMAEQQALLGTGRERELASLENRLLQQGRLGMATGGTSTGMMAANPELEAWYNAKRQQDLGLAAQATQGGMDYAKFGAGMVGSGGDMLKGMYGTQQAAYQPYHTALGGAGYIEGLGQQAMDAGINIGAKGTAASAQSGLLLGQGMQNAAATQYKADAISPWATMLSGAGSALQQDGQPQQKPYTFNPYTGKRL